jgi:hypothetical protein
MLLKEPAPDDLDADDDQRKNLMVTRIMVRWLRGMKISARISTSRMQG